MYLERFIPSVAEIRTALFNFYHEKYEQLLYHKLIDACVKEHMKISINTTEVKLIEKRQGSSLNQNFGIEQGQGLLLLVMVIIQTLLASSKNLIMKTCYPSKSRFSTKATDYGSKHEKVTKNILIEYLSNIYENISVIESGLFRSEVYPYLGASHDVFWNIPVVK